MPNSPTSWTAVFNRLNRDTQEGKLKWSRYENADYDDLYLTTYKEWNFGVFRYSFKNYHDDTGEWYTDTSIGGGLFDARSKKETYRVPERQGLPELFEAVQ